MIPWSDIKLVSRRFDIVSFLQDYVEVRPYPQRVGQYMILCPYCMTCTSPTHRAEWKPNVSQKKGIFGCFKCKTCVPLLELVMFFGGMDREQAYEFMKTGVDTRPMDVDEVDEEWALHEKLWEQRSLEEIIKLPEFPLPPSFISIVGQQIPYTQYRKITQEAIDTHGLGWCPPGAVVTDSSQGFPATYDYSNYLIIPDRDINGRVLYWIGRDMTHTKKLRYRNPPVSWTSIGSGAFLFNFHRAKQFKRVVITEGCFKAMRVGPDGVATYGLGLKGLHIQWLLYGKFQQVVLMPDNDGSVSEEWIQKECAKLWAMFDVRVARLPGPGQPDDFENPQLRTCIDNAEAVRQTPFISIPMLKKD